MKLKFILAVVTILIGYLNTEAQEVSGYPIGYCNGQMSTSSTVKYNVRETTLSTALYIPASYARTVEGNRIESLRVAICSTHNVDSLRVWVRTALDGPDLASGTAAAGSYVQGWNTINLDIPYDIPEGTEGFYMGYSYYQKAKSGAISSLPESRPEALWVQCGTDGEWTDRSDEGTLCIEGMVFGDRLPRLNLQLLNVTTDKVYIISNATLSGVAEVRNIATQTVTGFELEAVIDGTDTPCITHVDCELPYGATQRIAFRMYPAITTSDPGEVEAQFMITTLDEGNDEDPTDNGYETSFRVLEHAYPRTVLVEEFTTENCPNCPRVSNYLHQLTDDPAYRGRFETVCHHSGYHYDLLTTPFDIEYEWFYNDNGGTYAPGIMVDRCLYNDNSAVFCPSSVEQLSETIDNRLAEPALVSVNVDADYLSVTEEKNILQITVSGERCQPDVLSDGTGHITVYLVENNIAALHQAGAGNDYVHQHVNRTVNATWGEPISWNDDCFSYVWQCEIDPSWKKSDLQVIAVIGTYLSDDPTGCTVENVASCQPEVSYVDSIINDYHTSKIAKVYTPDGYLIPLPMKGLNIIRYTDGTVRKVYLN
ncbi:MAG: Omp28-related outer membrane protein [Muribaculaceae bacterium]|nr:Omp28-related outer membrane protein [Muribaculaceae bacterium]